MGFIQDYFKVRAVRKYVYQLAPALKSKYGASPSYTYSQIINTIIELRLSKRFQVYAVVMFNKTLDEETSDKLKLHQELIDILRLEVSNIIFNRVREYETTDILKESKSDRWHGGRQDLPNA